MGLVDRTLAEQLYRQAGAARWRLPLDSFIDALEASVAKSFASSPPSQRDLSQYLSSLHCGDLALACACAEGIEPAWDHFMRELRPVLYKAAGALDASGGAREIADSLYAELYGLERREGVRRSLLRHFHGRSSLATWLRAVLSQRYIDRLRATRRVDPLPEELPDTRPPAVPDSDCERYGELVRVALGNCCARLAPRDRLRLACYYQEGLTLAETGRLLKEHEASVSRNLAKTRKSLKQQVEMQLRGEGFSSAEIERGFECVAQDAGTLDLLDLLQET